MTALARAARWLGAERLALPLAALVAAACELVALRAVYVASFGAERRIPEAADNPLGHAVLWGLGLTGAALAAAGAYRMLRRGRLWLAALVVPLVCFPVLVLAFGGMYASLVVAAIL